MSQKSSKRRLKAQFRQLQAKFEQSLARAMAGHEKEREGLARLLEMERDKVSRLEQAFREDPLGYFKIHVSRDNRFDGYGRYRDEVMAANVSWNPRLIAFRIEDENFGSPYNVAREVDPLIMALCDKIRKTIVDAIVNKR